MYRDGAQILSTWAISLRLDRSIFLETSESHGVDWIALPAQKLIGAVDVWFLGTKF
jgi:hypothetical protein